VPERSVYAGDGRFHAPAVTSSISSLRAHDSSRLDWDALQEELEALGRQEFRELVNRLGVLLGHLLQWQLQPERRTRSWFLSVRDQRRAIARLLEQNPSLASKRDEALDPATCCDTRGDWTDLGL